MADTKKEDKGEGTPSPVDVQASIPLEVKIIKESIDALGGNTEGSEIHAPIPSTTPTPVLIAEGQKPVPVIVETNKSMIIPTVVKGEGDTLSPLTTEQEDIVAEGQRKIDLLLESTKSNISVTVVLAGVAVNCLLAIIVIAFNREVTITQMSILFVCLQFINIISGVIIGFYFSRTNPLPNNDVGKRPVDPPYIGR